jgi:intein-encoded DNA endonuclease-like protein
MISCLMLFRKKAILCSKNYTKHTNTLCWQNVYIVKLDLKGTKFIIKVHNKFFSDVSTEMYKKEGSFKVNIKWNREIYGKATIKLAFITRPDYSPLFEIQSGSFRGVRILSGCLE